MPGKLFFTLLMAGCMSSIMATFNGMRHYDWNIMQFLAESHWVYPLVVPLAITVRLFIAGKIADIVIPKLIVPHFTGVAKALLTTVANVSLMCPLMTAVMTALLQGFDNFGANYLGALPLSLSFAVLMNYLVVSPSVKLLHYNVISSVKGMRIMWFWSSVMRPVAALFN